MKTRTYGIRVCSICGLEVKQRMDNLRWECEDHGDQITIKFLRVRPIDDEHDEPRVVRHPMTGQDVVHHRTAEVPTEPRRQCPDGGTCHHNCDGAACFRVASCAPLTGVYEDEEWPTWLREVLNQPESLKRAIKNVERFGTHSALANLLLELLYERDVVQARGVKEHAAVAGALTVFAPYLASNEAPNE